MYNATYYHFRIRCIERRREGVVKARCPRPEVVLAESGKVIIVCLETS